MTLAQNAWMDGRQHIDECRELDDSGFETLPEETG